MDNILIYFIVIAVTVLSGYFVQSLTKSGAIAAAGVGFSVAAAFGWKGLAVLGLFFATSSFWSKYKREVKAIIEQKHEKGARRDWQQVLANGGIAALSSLFFFIFESHIWTVVFAISIASANSDTWASEIGALSKKAPIFIGNLKRAEKGTSGAVSPLGTFAAVSGALLIASFSGYLFNLPVYETFLILIAGFLGNVIDTLMGAFFQATYKCKVCSSLTEKKDHCGRPALLIRGISLMNNDMVNFLSCLGAVFAGVILSILFW